MKHSQSLRDAFNYLFQEELDYLYEVARSLPDNPSIVNIGAGAGTSGVAFLEARPDSTVTTIDVTKDDSPFGCLVAEMRVAQAAGVSERLTQIHGDSVLVGSDWDNGHVDLVFIDGDHSYGGCMGDMQTWLANLKDGGYILVHDYNKKAVFDALGDYDHRKYPHHRHLPGVDQAVNEWIDSGPVEFIGTVATIAIFRKGD